jgi:TP901 family phage tail tape measure protein
MATNTEKVVVQVVVKGGSQLDKLDKKTGKATKSVGGLTKGMLKMAGGIAAAAVAFKAIGGALSAAMMSFKGFEFQMAKVKAITGANNTQFKMLTKSAKDLGRTTFFTATQVGELQANYGKLGFTTGEILKAQEATLALATATDTDLARAAVVAGAAVRGFGLDASETQRVTDVMAKSFTSSAMDIEKWQTSMTKVAPIAAAAGISIEATAAVMSKLTDTGIEASIAGTSLRNIFLKMQDSSSDLSQFLGYTVNSSNDLDRALQDLNKAGLSNEEVMGLVDLRQVAAFNTMVRGADDISALTTEFNHANGALGEMVLIIEDTLEGDIKKLTSAADGLKTELGEKLSPEIRGITQDITDMTNSATDNADAIAEIGNRLLNWTKKVTGFNFMANQIDRMKWALNKLTGTEGWREFSDFIGFTTEAKDTSAEDRLARLNEGLQTTLDLSNANTKTTKGSIFTTEQAIIVRQKELDLLKEKSSAGGGMFDAGLLDGERNRLNKELELLRESLANRKDVLFEFEQETKSSKKATDDAAKKIQDRKDATALADAKKERDKEFASKKNEVAIEYQTLENIHKQALIDGDITQATYDEAAFDMEQQRLEDMKNLLITYGEDVSVINGTILDNELNMISSKSAAAAKAAQDKLDDDAKAKKDRDEQIAGVAQLGDQLINLAGEDEKMQAIKKVGIQLSAAAAIANNIEALSLAAKGVAKQSTLLFPANLIAMAGTIGTIISLFANIKAMKDSFGDGGIVETFANGGMVNGKSHAQGGEKFAVGGRVVELEGGEAVINKRSTSMFSSQLSAMNAAGGGVKFADGGLLNQPSFSQQQFNALGQNQMMGAMGSSGKVVVVEADITSSQNTVSVIQSQATI